MLGIIASKEPKKTWKREFILSLREHGIPAVAAEQVGVRMSRVRAAKKADPKFVEFFEEAIELANGRLEHNARLQAMSGSERLMIKLLEGNIPEKYSKVEQNVNNTFVKAYVGFSPDLWDQDAVAGELVAQGLIANSQQPTAEVEDYERDNTDSDISAFEVADQAAAG